MGFPLPWLLEFLLNHPPVSPSLFLLQVDFLLLLLLHQIFRLSPQIRPWSLRKTGLLLQCSFPFRRPLQSFHLRFQRTLASPLPGCFWETLLNLLLHRRRLSPPKIRYTSEIFTPFSFSSSSSSTSEGTFSASFLITSASKNLSRIWLTSQLKISLAIKGNLGYL